MFECDMDLDLIGDLGLGQPDVDLEEMISENIEEARVKLDNGLCQELFKEWRARDQDIDISGGGKYRIIILAAMMMKAGAKIDEDDMDYLRRILPGITSRNGYHMPLCDDCFRDPGKAQFTAALEHYKAGLPRDFSAPRSVLIQN